MADGIKMRYEDMERSCNDLERIVSEIVNNKTTMINKVNELCETWNSKASERHQEEFQSVGANIDKLTEMVSELTNNIKRYTADMNQLDDSYA